MPPSKITKEIALKELARRKALRAGEKGPWLEQYLFDRQLTFVRDPAPFKTGVTTRRAGKTISCAADLLETADLNPGTIGLYITLSRKNAKRLIWPEFKKIAKQFGLNAKPNESDLSLTFPNGSMIYLLGAKDRQSIEDFRGMPVIKAYLDESQSFPAYIQQLIDDVLGPALMDYNGQLILIGTPGPIPSGYFFKLTKNPEWSHHRWSFFDNPKLPFLKKGITHQQMLERELKRRGVTIEDPSIRREWFGEWSLDEESLVYRYNEDKCHYEKLPSNINWTYILGVDLGFEDADALAVLAYSEHSPNTYLLEEVVTKHQDLTGLCSQIDSLKKKYDITKIVIDTGGLGKKIAEEISKRYTIPMVAAEKHRKVEYIELMNDALRTGKLKIRKDSLFAFDAGMVEWDHEKSTPDKLVISKRFHSDICEAVLYAWRESYAFAYQPPEEESEYGTTKWGYKQADLMFNAELEKLEKAKEELEVDIPFEFDNDSIQSLDRPPIRYQSKFLKKKPP